MRRSRAAWASATSEVSRFLRRWGAALAIVTLVVLYAAVKVAAGEPDGMVWAGVLLPAAIVFSPAIFPRPQATRAEALAAPHRVAIYYKPADIFSLRLRFMLGNVAKKALWVDTIADPQAEAWMREINRGDVLTPTVVIGAELKRNPNPHWVGRHLLASVPDTKNADPTEG